MQFPPDAADPAPLPRKLRLGRHQIPLPQSPLLRIVLGSLLVVGGMFSFLPVLGVWMIPLGLIVLSIDLPPVRRWRRRFTVWFHRRYPKLAAWTDPGPQNGLRDEPNSR
ncbi:hypothetical protein ACUN0C_03385 [Faunimonas sp. B44]|uniref:hypothetical protein n=1 Tax=Faunimonas sp. B44 TaxID=3461493 RepID=UPI004044BE61